MSTSSSLRDRFVAFVAEQSPFALGVATAAFDRVAPRPPAASEAGVEALRAPLAAALRSAADFPSPPKALETTPGVTVRQRLAQGLDALVALCDGFLRREAIAAGLTATERREILRGMVL